ncbi:MAG: CBS domain-containing protein [Planctomycetota bacterium]|jgi:CBS domain-containing protein
MESSQTVTEALVLELAEKSFKTFCDDISGMFGIDIQCNPQQVTAETTNGLQIRFKDLVALYPVNAEGTLDGTFHLVFDQQGLFILAGIVAMQPELMILEDAKSGSLEKAQKENNTLKEVGAALVGSWDRVYRKGLDGHGRFEQKNIFIGNPWDNPQESIGLAANEQVTLVSYEMTVGSFPAFKCGIIFTKAFLANTPKPAAEQSAYDKEKAREEGEDKTQAKTENKAPNISQGMKETKEIAQDEESVTIEKTAAAQESEAVVEKKPNDVEKHRPISQAIKKLTQSSAVSSDESAPATTAEKPAINKDALFTVCAKDIMQKDAIWANPNDSVQQALAKIHKNDAAYLMIGRGQVLEGVVSKTNLTAAMSPYLRSIFAKWRRPLDDATLQIRVKWIMVKPASTIQPDTPLTAIMEKMCLTDLRCLPVVDKQGKAQGLITVFDILKMFLNQSSHIKSIPK